MYFNSDNAFQISIDHGSNIMRRQMYLPSFKKKSFLFCSQNLNDRLFNIFIDYPIEIMIIHASDYLNLMIDLLAEFSAT